MCGLVGNVYLLPLKKVELLKMCAKNVSLQPINPTNAMKEPNIGKIIKEVLT